MVSLRLRYFGSPRVSSDNQEVRGFRSQKALALLCYLALTGRAHTRSHLAGLLWEDMPEASASMNLRKTIMNLRRLLGLHLEIDRQEIGLNLLPYAANLGAAPGGAQADSRYFPETHHWVPSTNRSGQSACTRTRASSR